MTEPNCEALRKANEAVLNETHGNHGELADIAVRAYLDALPAQPTEALILGELRAEVNEHGVLDIDQAEEVLDRLEQVERHLQSVRELHVEEWVTVMGVPGIVCKACREPVESEPCSTIQALDGAR